MYKTIMEQTTYFVRVEPHFLTGEPNRGGSFASKTGGTDEDWDVLFVGNSDTSWAPEENTALAEVLGNSEVEFRCLPAQLLAMQELERKRIATDLHDGLGQSLSLIKLSTESVIQLIRNGAYREAVESLQDVGHKVKDTITELHRTTMGMRPPMLDDFGILPTLSWFFREFESIWKDKAFDRDITISEYEVPIALKTPIFRILQEATNNIVKHANADCIRVGLHAVAGTVQLSIEDDGRGFDPTRPSICNGGGRGFGLMTMRERAKSSGGVFEMKSAPGQGTRITITWVLGTEGTDDACAEPSASLA